MAFDPTTLFPGLAGDREGSILRIRPENLWQDVAGTTAVADGDPVRRIDDISVNGRDFVVFATSTPMTYHTDGVRHWLTSSGGDAPGVGFKGADSWSFMNGAPYSVGAAVSFADPGEGDQYFFGTLADGSGSSGSPKLANSVAHCGVRTATQSTIGHWFNDQNFAHVAAVDKRERHICEFKNPGSEYTVDGVPLNASATTPSSLDEVGTATVFIRTRFDGSPDVTSMAGNLYGMIIVVDTISAQEKADIDEWLREEALGPGAGHLGGDVRLLRRRR